LERRTERERERRADLERERERRADLERERRGERDGERLPRESSTNLISRPLISFLSNLSIARRRSDDDLKQTTLQDYFHFKMQCFQTHPSF